MARIVRGEHSAPVVVPISEGLLGVAKVTEHSRRASDELWLQGYSIENSSYPLVRIVGEDGVADSTVSGVVMPAPFFAGETFFIEVELRSSGLGLVSEDLPAEILTQIETATQKAVEFELWEGSNYSGTDALFFRKNSGINANVVTSGGVDAAVALARLEQSIALSPSGGQGILHMTRDVASTLGNRLLYKDGYICTILGTHVVVGSGYTGNGKTGATGTAATATNKWMFVTGGIEVHLGAPEIVNTRPQDGFDTTTNDIVVRVHRPASVHFDPSIFAAAQVTLPA
jgi:hypothetical protein